MLGRLLQWRHIKRAVTAVGVLCAASYLLLLVYTASTGGLMHDEEGRRYFAGVEQDILRRSQNFVRELARQAQQRHPSLDHPYLQRKDSFELKKNLAVLLVDMLARLDRLDAPNRTSRDVASLSTESPLLSLLTGDDESCAFPEGYTKKYPHCQAKLDWLRDHWQSEACYMNYGVDGSFCSFAVYLSEVELFCPRLTIRRNAPLVFDELRPDNATYTRETARVPDNLSDLMDALDRGGKQTNFVWMKRRIRSVWNSIRHAASVLKINDSRYERRTILVYLGFLTKESGIKFGEKSLHGGPLGEILQWSDLFTTLYALGHEILVSTDTKSLLNYTKHDIGIRSSCPVHGNIGLVYTDIIGLRMIRRKMGRNWGNYKCKLRVLDSFGTQAEFNAGGYFRMHSTKLGGGKNEWGGHELELGQFLTFYPHSPDNSFLGFIIPHPKRSPSVRNRAGRPCGLVYGKEDYMWKNSREYLSLLNRHIDLYATVSQVPSEKSTETATIRLENVPTFVHNLGLLNATDLQFYLQKCRLFVGLGFPYEGPAPLEAIANGAIFLNPAFNPAKSRQNTHFFHNKPTLRSVASQNPYAELFIGEPHVFTVDIANEAALEATVLKALQTDVQPYIPFEYTARGFLERVNAFVVNQSFCPSHTELLWPPAEALQVRLASASESCSTACFNTGLLCERTFFHLMNTVEHVSNFTACRSIDYQPIVSAPAFDLRTKECILQSDALLYSCSSIPSNDKLIRVCPCRDYTALQTALCSIC